MTKIIEERAVHHSVYDPANSLFKSNRNDKAESETVFCKLEHCPFREKGQCLWIGILSFVQCPYGRFESKKGPTKRAQSCRKWISNEKEMYSDVPVLSYPTRKLAFIGDYVYLPYAHMDMCKDVNFLKHSCVFVSGIPLISREHWTIDTVIRLVKFRPQALMGGEIQSYQKEEIPKFVQHLREIDSEMFGMLVEREPRFNVEPNYVGRKAILKTLNFPISFTMKRHEDYPIDWRWDGEKLTTNSMHVYGKTWGNIELDSMEMIAIPKENACIEVQKNEWVNENTQFVD